MEYLGYSVHIRATSGLVVLLKLQGILPCDQIHLLLDVPDVYFMSSLCLGQGYCQALFLLLLLFHDVALSVYLDLGVYVDV